jgi:hypothetical protein
MGQARLRTLGIDPDFRSGTNVLAPRRDTGDPSPGVATLDRVEAILRNPAIYELATLIPQPRLGGGGRQRDFPAFMYLVFEALISVYGSARQVEAELAHRAVWKVMRRTVKRAFPDNPSVRLPPRPMRRHHYLYARNRYLSEPRGTAAPRRHLP